MLSYWQGVLFWEQCGTLRLSCPSHEATCGLQATFLKRLFALALNPLSPGSPSGFYLHDTTLGSSDCFSGTTTTKVRSEQHLHEFSNAIECIAQLKATP
ncbi:UNVERIFIED_CONTAM: hypothetical protein FKN15_014368 [Acipenser sinensis]